MKIALCNVETGEWVDSNPSTSNFKTKDTVFDILNQLETYKKEISANSKILTPPEI